MKGKTLLPLSWWKILTIILLFYTFLAGFMADVPRQNILNESIRNLYFHVPMWFGMIILLFVSMVYAIKYLISNNLKHDTASVEFANTGIVLGVLGILTGSVWAKNTWGTFWTNDAKLNMAAIGLLIYFAYLVLRSSFEDELTRARVSGVINIIAYFVLIPLLFILPRMVDSLHPGNGGNPGFNSYDLDNKMRMVFYPAVIGWTLLGTWISTLRVRVRNLENKEELTETMDTASHLIN